MTQSFSPPQSPTGSVSLHLGSTVTQSRLASSSNREKQRKLASTQEGSPIDANDTFSILIASDCHLGYADRDELRKMDSINTFQEVLNIAKEKAVDFLLLGGDLFHENKPSRFTAQQCAALLRNNCMGEGEIRFDVVSDPKKNFAHMEEHFQRVNINDPDLGICLPVFSIHGNHDDPSGLRYLSELDLLHTYGLINYFGKVKDVDNIEIDPLLFTKGRTKLAIFGLGSVRDERLHRAYLHKHVKLKRPADSPDDWFNIFVIHQNRPTGRGHTNYIPEQFLDNWLDLVIWGHEHDPIPKPVLNSERGFEVLQPGSTVATSMSDGEGKPKFCYLMEVCGQQYRVEAIPLKTIRPFVVEDINLADAGFFKDDTNMDNIRHDVEKFLNKKMERLIRRVEVERMPTQPKEPLIRLRVFFGNIEPLNPILFGQKFLGRVANPRDIILPMKQKTVVKGKLGISQVEVKPIIVVDTTTIEDLVVDYFGNKPDDMMLFDPKLLTEALQRFVHSDDKEVITDVYDFQKTRIESYLSEHKSNEIDLEAEHLGEHLRKYRSEHSDIPEYVNEFLDWRNCNNKGPKPVAPVRGRGRGATTTAARKRTAASAAAADRPIHSTQNSGVNPIPSTSGTTTRPRGRVARGQVAGTRGRGRGVRGGTPSESGDSVDDSDGSSVEIVAPPKASPTRNARRATTKPITTYFARS